MNVQESDRSKYRIEAVYTVKQITNKFSACGSLFCVKQAEKAPAFRNKGLTVKVWGGGERESEGEEERRLEKWCRVWRSCANIKLWVRIPRTRDARWNSVHRHWQGCYGEMEAETGCFLSPCQSARLVYSVQLWTEWRLFIKVEGEDWSQRLSSDIYICAGTCTWLCSHLTNVQYICMCCTYTGKVTEYKVWVCAQSCSLHYDFSDRFFFLKFSISYTPAFLSQRLPHLLSNVLMFLATSENLREKKILSRIVKGKKKTLLILRMAVKGN